MNPERIPIEELEKLMLEKSFSELTEREKEFALSQLASPAEYDDLRNTLLQIREVFSQDKSNLKMPAAGKEALMAKFRDRKATSSQAPVIKIYQRRWIWAAAASLLLIVSLIFVNQQYNTLKSNQEIALQSDPPEQNLTKEQQNHVQGELNESSVNSIQEEATSAEQESEVSNSNVLTNAPITLDAVEKTDASKSEGTYFNADERQSTTTTSAAETKNAAPTVSLADGVMDMEYRESESLQTATKKEKESKKDKSVKGNTQAMPAATGKSQVTDEDRKASIRKAFLFTDI